MLTNDVLSERYVSKYLGCEMTALITSDRFRIKAYNTIIGLQNGISETLWLNHDL